MFCYKPPVVLLLYAEVTFGRPLSSGFGLFLIDSYGLEVADVFRYERQ